jgi:ABC-type uncharacterized transport system permease subunit
MSARAALGPSQFGMFMSRSIKSNDAGAAHQAAIAALLFGAADALQLSLQIFDFGVPPQVLLSLPYVLTILAVSGLLGKATQPAALLTPYVKE